MIRFCLICWVVMFGIAMFQMVAPPPSSFPAWFVILVTFIQILALCGAMGTTVILLLTRPRR